MREIPNLTKPPKGALQLSYIDKELYRRYKGKFKDVIDIQLELSTLVNTYMEERLKTQIGNTRGIEEKIKEEGAELCIRE